MQVCLRSAHGTLLTAELDHSLTATRDYEEPGVWELWTHETHADGFALKSHHGGYLRAEGGGGSTIAADGVYDTPGPWEIFRVVAHDSGGHALLCHDSLHYVTAELDGTVTTRATAIGEWELWTFTPDPWAVPVEPDRVSGNRILAGPVRLEGRICKDDNGAFLALCCSFFWVSRAFKDFKDRYDANMKFLATYGFNCYRGFASVGGWPDPDAWHNARTYPEWALELLPQWLDDAYTRYQLRCSLTLFDGEKQYQTDSEQDAFVHAVCDVLLGTMADGQSRLVTIQDVQVANEYGPCGWDYEQGIERLRRHARTLRERLGPGVVISISSRNTAMGGGATQEHYDECHRLFDGLLPDIVTATRNHDSRETTLIDGHWRHVRQGWERVIHDEHGNQLEPDASIDDEPMGPESSVASENDPSLIVQKALVSFVSGRHQHCYHPDSGIWSNLLNPAHSGMGEHVLIEDHPESKVVGEVFQKLMPLLPPEMTTWQRTSHHISPNPFGASFEKVGDVFTQCWPDEVTDYGVVRAFGVINGNQFVIALTGVKDRFEMKWTEPLEFEVYTCKDGEMVQQITSATGGGQLVIPESLDTDLLIIGRVLMTWLALVLVLATAGCARYTRVRVSPRCADGLPPLVLVDKTCPPDGICGYSCLPDRWTAPRACPRRKA